MQILIIAHTVAYMLKVMKNGIPITVNKAAFAAIRHGNYDQFGTLLPVEPEFMIVYNAGEVKTNPTEINQKDDGDFVGLMKSGNGMKKFYQECLTEYGEIDDPDISDEVYRDVVLFEIGLRMHANNADLQTTGRDFEKVIDALADHFKLSDQDRKHFHEGRRFLNMIKHNKGQFPNYHEGMRAFSIAKEIQHNHGFKVF